MNRRLLAASIVVVLVALSSPATAQQRAGDRRLTTLETIRQFPGFFNLQNVVVRGEFVESNGRIVLKSDERQMDVLLGDVASQSGLVEVRAQLLDVGRLEPADPRLTRYVAATGRGAENWPRPGDEIILNVTAVARVDAATVPSPRALALEPWKFEGQRVTVTGQFRGRNLLGDMPGSPAKSRYDFVLRGSEGAIWVSGLRPRGKGFELNVDARVDTSKWVTVTGTVRRERAMVMIEGQTIALAQPPGTAAAGDDDAPPPSPPAPGEVVFSSPSEGETDVPIAAPIRVQFSRGLNPATLEGNIRVTRMGTPPEAPPLAFQVTYDAPSRSIQIRLNTPPERLATYVVETREGLRTFDGGAITPWKVTFSFGG